MKIKNKSQILKNLSNYLLEEDMPKAKKIASEKYPFNPSKTQGRKYTHLQSMRVFVRDGFIDRYSGEKLINPGVLRLLSILMPDELPFHPNWKMSESHIMYWELFPTIDHVVPIAIGGNDTDDNRITTSMLRNSAKSNWTLEELGWKLHKPGNISSWDGLSQFFINYISNHTQLLSNSYLKKWHTATKKCLTPIE